MSDQKFDTNESNASLYPEKEKKNFFSRVGDTVSLFFTKDTNKAINTIIDQEAPIIQRTAAIKSAVMKKNLNARIPLIELVKGEHGDNEELKIQAAKALSDIGEIYATDIKSSYLIDLLEIYLTTIDNRLSQEIRTIFLRAEGLPYIKFIGKTLITRFQIDDDVSSDAWQIFARALYFAYTFAYNQNREKLNAEVSSLPQNANKQVQTIEHTAYLARRIITILDDSRKNLCEYMAKDPNGQKLSELLMYHSLTTTYHESATELVACITKLFDFVLHDKKELRDLAMEELKTVETPIVYDSCKTLITDPAPRYPDICEGLTAVITEAISRKDILARNIFISISNNPPVYCENFFYSEVLRLAKLDEEFQEKMIAVTKGFLKRSEASDKVIIEMIKSLFSFNLTDENLDFLIYIVTGKIKSSIEVAVEVVTLIVSLNKKDFEFYEKTSKVLKLIMKNKVPDEIKSRIISESKKNITDASLSCLEIGAFLETPTVSAEAIRAIFDIARSGDMESDRFIDFLCKMLSDEKVLRDNISTSLAFLKNYKYRNSNLRQEIAKILSSNDQNFRFDAFILSSKWLKMAEDDNEFNEQIKTFIEIIQNQDWKYNDIYQKTIDLFESFVLSDEEKYKKIQNFILNSIQNALNSKINDNFKIILCRMFENLLNKGNEEISNKALTLLNNTIASENVSTAVKLHTIEFFAVEKGDIINVLKYIISALKDEEYENKSAILLILVKALDKLEKYTIKEKIDALKTGSPVEVCEHVKFEILMGMEICPIINELLKRNFMNRELVQSALTLAKYMDYARTFVKFIYEFTNYPDDEIIRARAIETAGALIYPPYNQDEGEILLGIMKTAKDNQQAVHMRRTAILALEKIADPAFEDVLSEIALDKKTKEELRILSINALASLCNENTNKIFVEILKDGSSSWILKEAIIKVIGDSITFNMLDTMTELMVNAPGTVVKNEIIQAMKDSGFENVVKIKELEVSCENYLTKLNIIKTSAERAIEEKKTAVNALETVESQIKEHKEKTEAINAEIRELQQKIQEAEYKWQIENSSSTEKMQQLSSSGNKKEFIAIKQSLLEKKDEYDELIDSSNLRIQRLEAGLSKRAEEFEELSKRYESVKAEIERFDRQINKPKNEGDEIRQKINEANQEKKMLYEEIMRNRQNMERSIYQRMMEKRNKKAELEEERDMYNKFIFKNIEKNIKH